MCSLLPDSLKAKEAGGAPLGFQLLKLKRKVKQEVVEQVWQYTVGVLGKVKPMHQLSMINPVRFLTGDT